MRYYLDGVCNVDTAKVQDVAYFCVHKDFILDKTENNYFKMKSIKMVDDERGK